MSRRFFIVDVFTDRAYGGNQLGVFPEAADIPGAEMQQIARELNYSETTFVLPPRKPGHTHRVRIFTPAAEIPFAGHPNVGTAVVLATLDLRAGQAGRRDFVFDEDAGTVLVSAVADRGAGRAELTIERGVDIGRLDAAPDILAAALSLPLESLSERPPWIASAGLRFCCIPLRDRDAVRAARFRQDIWERELPAKLLPPEIYAIAGDFTPGGRLKVRMWAPADGVPEDPATGSAAAALVASLAMEQPEANGVFAWTIEQGAEIGRPSLINASAEKRDGKVVAIRVGGGAVVVAEGVFL
jgi:trans-2,3-dihydro-3-hydroxyanthranilate isomerase